MTSRNTRETTATVRALDRLPGPVLVYGSDGRVSYANAELRRRLGNEPTAVGDPTDGDIDGSHRETADTTPLGDSVESVLGGYDPPETADRESTETEKSAEQLVRLDEVAYTAETELLDGAGAERVVLLRDTPSREGSLLDESDPLTASDSSESTTRDLSTDETATDPFERIFEFSNDAIFVIDPGTETITRANRRAADLLGYDHAELLSLEPRDIHPHDYEAFEEFTEDVYETGASWTTELSCYTCDGEVIPAEISGTVVEIDGRRQLLASVRDISTRIEQQRDLHRLSRAVEATTDGIALLDRDGVVTYANEAFAVGVGFENGTAVTGARWSELYDDGDRFQMAVLPSVESDGDWTETVRIDQPGDERVYSVSVTSFEDDLLVVSRDVTDEWRHRERLRGLTEASRAFVDTEDRDAVADTALDVIADTLGFDTACLRLYDEQSNSLERTAVSPAARELLDSEVAYDLEASRAGQAYRTGESLLNNPSEDAYAGDRAHLHVPVGDVGVVTLLADEPFSETDIQLVELFAETLRTAFTRAERVRELRARQTELERRGEELTAANEFGDLVADVVRSVLGTSTRGETERAVCDRLAASQSFDAAWLVTDGDERTVRASADADADRLVESDTTAFVHTPFVTQLLSEADRTGDVVVRRRRFESGRDGESTDDLTTAAAIPVACGGQSFGTLVVASAGGDSLPGLVRNGLELLAETLCFALVADRTRLALVSKELVEVEISLRNRLAVLSEQLDCRCVLRETTPTDDGSFTHVVDIEGASDAAVIEFFEEHTDSPTQSPTVVESDGDGTVLQVRASPALPELLVDAGGNVRSVVAEGGETRVTVELPRQVEVGTVLDTLASVYDDVRLRAKRQQRRIDPTRVVGDTADDLTERQGEVVCAAYRAGYYEWPRDNTAEEVAESLDIAGSTFHQHLRTAERKLAGHLCATRGENETRDT
jgi:PAS domain S-box-containing protein